MTKRTLKDDKVGGGMEWLIMDSQMLKNILPKGHRENTFLWFMWSCNVGSAVFEHKYNVRFMCVLSFNTIPIIYHLLNF